MTTRSLLELRTAFQLDRAGVVDRHALAFIDERLALLARELQARDVARETSQTSVSDIESQT